jgi:hypothetical protein
MITCAVVLTAVQRTQCTAEIKKRNGTLIRCKGLGDPLCARHARSRNYALTSPCTLMLDRIDDTFH